MNNHIRRIEALEVSMSPPIARRWHRVIQYVGQSREDAIGAYESEHGVIDISDHLVVRRVVGLQP